MNHERLKVSLPTLLIIFFFLITACSPGLRIAYERRTPPPDGDGTGAHLRMSWISTKFFRCPPVLGHFLGQKIRLLEASVLGCRISILDFAYISRKFPSDLWLFSLKTKKDLYRHPVDF